MELLHYICVCAARRSDSSGHQGLDGWIVQLSAVQISLLVSSADFLSYSHLHLVILISATKPGEAVLDKPNRFFSDWCLCLIGAGFAAFVHHV